MECRVCPIGTFASKGAQFSGMGNLVSALPIGGCDFHPCVAAYHFDSVQPHGGYGVSVNVCRGGNDRTGMQGCDGNGGP